MNQRTLGKTGLRVGELGFGAAPVAFLKSERDATAALVNALLDAGVNLIDTAMAYPGSHEFLGEHLSPRRDHFVLVSKCGNVKFPGCTGTQWSAALVSESVDHALKQLRTDVIDVMLLHSCDLETLQKGEALGALVKARDAGKIRFAGYSGDNEAAAYAATLPDVAVIETSINVVDQRNIDLVLPVVAANNVGVLAKRPIGNGFWKGVDGLQGMYKNYAGEYLRRFAEMKLTAEDLGIEPSQWPDVALRFTLGFPEVSCAIVGTTRLENARQNIESAARGGLTAGQVQTIRSRYASAPGADAWTGQT